MRLWRARRNFELLTPKFVVPEATSDGCNLARAGAAADVGKLEPDPPPSVLRSTRVADDDKKPVPREFPVEVIVDGKTRVRVTLLLAPGTTVTVKETNVTTEPTPKDHDG